MTSEELAELKRKVDTLLTNDFLAGVVGAIPKLIAAAEQAAEMNDAILAAEDEYDELDSSGNRLHSAKGIFGNDILGSSRNLK